MMKRKRVGLIPVQATAKARRLRWNRKALQGRPRKAHNLMMKLRVEADDSIDKEGYVVRHGLPQKKHSVAPGSRHCLREAVDSNRRGSKKH